MFRQPADMTRFIFFENIPRLSEKNLKSSDLLLVVGIISVFLEGYKNTNGSYSFTNNSHPPGQPKLTPAPGYGYCSRHLITLFQVIACPVFFRFAFYGVSIRTVRSGFRNPLPDEVSFSVSGNFPWDIAFRNQHFPVLAVWCCAVRQITGGLSLFYLPSA